MKQTLAAYNGTERGDGYDAYMRPVTRRDNVAGGITHRVQYIEVNGGDERILWCESEADARHATLYGPALCADHA
jgi:hypothetical protein